MIQTVVKRDGRIVGFDKERIASAIRKAMLKTEKGEDEELINQIVDRIEMKGNEQIPVDDIQNMVEKELMKSSRKDAAKVYITYRNQRDIARKAKTREVFLEIIEAKNNDITRENANMNADTPAGMMMKFASETTKPFVDDYLLSERSLNAVKNNYLHIHDKDYYPSKSLTCVSSRTNITIKMSDGRIEHVKASYLDKYFDEEPSVNPQMVSPEKFIWIMGRNGWTKITGISRRILTEDDNFYLLKTHKGCGLEVTGEHLIPVIDYKSGEEVVKKVDDIVVGDKLLKTTDFNSSEIKNDYIDVFQILSNCDEVSKDEIIIKNIKELREWLRYKYKIQSLPKLLNSTTYQILREEYDIPFDVLNTVSISLINCKDFLPLYLPISNELVEIIGYLHRYGAISTDSYQIAFNGLDKSINEKFKDTFNKVFSNHLTKHKQNGKEVGYLLSSKLLLAIFKKSFGCQYDIFNTVVPYFIMNGSDEIKWSYISAVIDEKNLQDEIKISNACQSYIIEMNTLFNSLDVKTIISEEDNMFTLQPLSQIDTEKVLDNLNCIKKRRDNRIYAQKPSNAVLYNPSLIKSKIELSTKNEVVYDLETVEHWWTANGYIVHNCLQHPLNKILSNGFAAGHGESRPTKRIETASIMGCISMETVQNEMHGGQAIPAFDFYLAPYVRKSYIEEVKALEKISGKKLEHLYDANIDDYVIKDLDELEGDERYKQHAINETVGRVHQSMEAFIHNMNTIHSRGGNQVVFSSINYGTDTSAEGRCVIRELLISTYEGIGNGSTAIFPIQIWKKKRGVSYLPEDRNYDLYKLACKVAARRFFPNFVNLDATFNFHEQWREDDPNRYQYEVATMGCRTRVFENRFGEKTSIGRGNLSFSTINIVRLAIECMNIESEEERVKAFFEKLDTMLETTALQLCDRYDYQKTALAKQFPLLMSGLWNGSEKLKPTDTVESVLNQGTLGIGFIGLAECLIALTGRHHGESEKSQELGLKIISHMRDRANEFSEKYQHNFSILATPAEGLSGKFTAKDRKDFGIIKGVTDKIYYTNSNHVPVYYKCSPKHKAEVEGPYHELTRGGHIFYVEIDGDATHNPQAIMDIVDLVDKYNIGYCSVNHNRNRCMDCGYEDAQDNLEICPKCGSHNIDKLQRITGYLVGTTDRWNKAKLAELHDRVVHK